MPPGLFSFGDSRRSGAGDADVHWNVVQALLEDDDRRAARVYRYPETRRESFLGGLNRLAPQTASEILSTGRRLDTASRLAAWPTVAVSGMLNGGKTSLVASFLSPRGRQRTLRGVGNRQGTHRFVLWLPEAWRDDVELFELLLERIGEAIGGSVEMLSPDPEVAHDQYNNAAGSEALLSVPLVATDAGLNDAGIGLLDCPDIVSDEAFGLGSPEDRRALLSKAAMICSAFIVVASIESSRDTTLGDLLRIAADLMPGVPRILAVNKVRPGQTPDQVRETFEPLTDNHGIESIYAAYDFEIPASDPFIPKIDGASTIKDDDRLPTFFSISADPDDNPPAAIPSERMLAALPERLDRGRLFALFESSQRESLSRVIWKSGWGQLKSDAMASGEQTITAQDALLDAALEFFAHRDFGGRVTELRLIQNERIVNQLMESFIATAPWYAKWGVKLSNWTGRIVGRAKKAAGVFRLSPAMEHVASDVKQKLRGGEVGGLLTPSRLVEAIRRHAGYPVMSHWPPPERIDEDGDATTQYAEAAEVSISRFAREGIADMNQRRLDEATRQMWAEVPMGKKLVAGVTPLAAALTTFSTVLLAPIDFGASAVFAASVSELLVATGLAGAAAWWAGNKNIRNIEFQAARQQLTDFHAILCDVHGVARPQIAPSIRVLDRSEVLAVSSVARGESIGGYVLPWVHAREEFADELRKILPPPQ